MIDCTDIKTWGAHLYPLGFLSYKGDTFNPSSFFLWGETEYNISSYEETSWSSSQIGSGIGKVQYDAVKAIDSFSDGALAILEGAPEFAIEKWAIATIATFKCGTAGNGDADNLFNNPIDVTVDAVDYVYVLDILSNGQPRIKIFDSQLQPVVGIGDSSLIPGDPISCDWDNYNDALHVLHSNGVAVIAK